MKNLYITSSGGSLFSYNIKSEILTKEYQTPNSNEYLLGITFDKKDLYFSSNYNIYHYQTDKNLVNIIDITSLGNAMIQHIKCIGGYLFVPFLNDNGIMIVNIKNIPKALYYIKIKPSAIKTYGDNISNITFDGKKFIIQFCSVKGEDNSRGSEADFPRTSGIICLDTNLNILSRKTNGMEVLLTEYVDGKIYSICNYHDYNNGNGALLVDNHPRISWSNEYTICDMSIDDDNIFLVGKLVRRSDTLFGGIIIHLDREFNLIDNKFFSGVGYFLGCSSMEDKTNLHKISDDELNMTNWKEGKINDIITVHDWRQHDNTIS